MLSTKVEDIKKNADSLTVVTDKGELETRYVINAAGCHSADIAKMVGDDRLTQTNKSGQYFVLDKAEGAKVNSVIFRCPDENGFKGILVSPTVHGNLIVGPDANPARDGDDVRTTSDILAMLRARGLESVPSINYRNIIRQYAGVRPTTQTKDFTINVSPACDRMINLAGMCSPGLSSAPAVGEEAARLLSTVGLELNAKENFKDERPPVVHLASMSADEKRALIAKNPAYGKIICRCETVTEGEIRDAIRRNPKPQDIDGVKRRTRSGMGRCQGGFCGPYVMELLAREMNVPMEQITKNGGDSYMVIGKIGE
jgi:glycerol-3-phosphate dehydrogenase